VAVDSGNFPAVKHFIEVGTSVNMCDPRGGLLPTSLHSCVHRGNIAIAELLIRNGVNMSAPNKWGVTPLHFAVSDMYPNDELVKLLLDAGADISASCGNYPTILCAATFHSNTSILHLLLQRGRILTICERDRANLLHTASKHGTAATVRLILEAGVNIEATNNSGQTALHCAVQLDSQEIVEVLLECGANVDAMDDEGLTPLQTFFKCIFPLRQNDCAAHRVLHRVTLPDACSWKASKACIPVCQFAKFDEPIVDRLLSAGANIRASSNSTRCALDWATFWVSGS
jgi:ankyrin repeat protein